jgi:biopolymer transport protein TolR
VNTQPLKSASPGVRLTEIFASRADRVLFVKAAPALGFSVVASAIDIAHSANVDRIALMPR